MTAAPTVTGPYELESMLNRGGMAEIYLARSRSGDRVCIKQIRSDFNDDAEFADMFRREAAIACALNHPNIVRTHEFSESPGQLYISMEYVEGLDLKTLLRRLTARKMTVPPAIALSITVSLLRALQAAHGLTIDGVARPVIHRDVSPHNILLSLKGEVKLADFGIAKAKGSSSATRTGVIKGKLAYLSPEQANGDPVEPASDLYCAGLVLFEMLSNRRFHSGMSEQEVLASVLSDRSPRVQWLSAPLNSLLTKLLQRRAADRFGNAADALAAIESLEIPIPDEAECAEFFRAVHRFDDLMSPGLSRDSDAPTVARSDTLLDEAPTRTSKMEIPVFENRRSSRTLRNSIIAIAAILLLTLLAVIVSRIISSGAVDVQVPASQAAPAEASRSMPDGKVVQESILPQSNESLIETGTVSTAQEPAAVKPTVVPARPKTSASSARPVSENSGRVANGFLELNCRPWAEVFVKDRSYGTTPLRKVVFPAGKHTVKLVNQALGAQKLVPVEIRSGETTRLSVQLP